MDESKYTYPEQIANVGFTEAEKKRWARNLKKLEKKWGPKPGRKRKKKSDDEDAGS